MQVILANVLARLGQNSHANLFESRGTSKRDFPLPEAKLTKGVEHSTQHAEASARRYRNLGFPNQSGSHRQPRLLSPAQLFTSELYPTRRQEWHVRDPVHGHDSRHPFFGARFTDHVPRRFRFALDPSLIQMAGPGRGTILVCGILLLFRRLARVLFPPSTLLPAPGVAVGTLGRQQQYQIQRKRPVEFDQVCKEIDDLRTKDSGQRSGAS